MGRKYQEIVFIDQGVSSNRAVVIPSGKKEVPSDPLTTRYYINGWNIDFINGRSYEILPGTSQRMETRIFGEPLYGDLDSDGKYDDAAFFAVQETGGTGIFFYILAAINHEGKYIGSKGVFLGDRIAPQGIRIVDGILEVNYSARKDTDPMTEAPSVGVTKYLHIENGELVEVVK
jgi:hypothetical protein